MAAKTKAKGLGKGLDALFGDAEVAPTAKKPTSREKQTEVKKVDKKRRRSEIKDFSELLEKNRIEVFNKMLAQLDSSYDYMEAYDYIVAAGGTYESWKKEFADTFKDMEDGLRIIPANINVGYIPIIYSVARGNYYFAIEKLFRRRLAENK